MHLPSDDCRFPHILSDGSANQNGFNSNRSGARIRGNSAGNGSAGIDEKFANLNIRDVWFQDILSLLHRLMVTHRLHLALMVHPDQEMSMAMGDVRNMIADLETIMAAT